MAKRSSSKRELIDTGGTRCLRSGMQRGNSRRWMMSGGHWRQTAAAQPRPR